MLSDILKMLAPVAETVLPKMFDAAVSGFSANVMRNMPDGTTAEFEIATDSDLNVCRQMRDEYVSQPDDIGAPYVSQ